LDKTIFYGDVHPNTLKCPSCRSRRVIRFGQKPRIFKMLPVGHRKVELVVNIPRLFCHDCGGIRQSPLAFAEPKKHYTRSLERFVIDLCRVHEGTPSAAFSVHRSRSGGDGIESLDSRSLLQRDPNTQTGGSEAICMEAFYFELAQTPHQHRQVGSH